MRHVMENKNLTLPDLQREFMRLRGLWRDQWIGLPAVAAGCLAQLGHPRDAVPGPGERAIAACIAAVAQAIEDDGLRRSRAGNEPRALSGAPSDAEWVLMLAMLAHDFAHPGKVNQFPGEIESHSVSEVQPLMQSAGVPDAVRTLVGELILMTDPARVRPHHEAMRGRAFDLDDAGCMAMLLQECDILASAMPDIGIDLTHQLASEWAQFSETMGASLLMVRSRITFLRNQAQFSSPASHLLGLPAMTAAEIRALEKTPAESPI